MKLNNTIFNRRTAKAIEKLTKISQYKDMKTFFSVAKLKAEYDNAQKPFDIVEYALAIEYCDKDEKGKPTLGPNNEYLFTEKRKEFQEKHNNLINQEIELNIDLIKIHLSDDKFLIEEGIINPEDVAALYGIIEFCE